jgi:hypothetical protein
MAEKENQGSQTGSNTNSSTILTSPPKEVARRSQMQQTFKGSMLTCNLAIRCGTPGAVKIGSNGKGHGPGTSILLVGLTRIVTFDDLDLDIFEGGYSVSVNFNCHR